MSGYDGLANAMRGQALAAGLGSSEPRHGIISSYDPNAQAVKVQLQPEGVESGWMPLGAVGVGAGFGLVVGPSLGEMVTVVFVGGSIDSGVIVARHFSTTMPGVPVPSGEAWLVHQSGSAVKLLNSGDIEINASGAIAFTAAAHQFNGPVVMSETLVTGGDVTDNVTTGNGQTMRGMREAYDSHTHSGVEEGDGTSGVPNQQV